MAKSEKQKAARGRRKPRAPKQKTVFVFQGGASRGAHQVGAMKYLEEIGVKPDIIIGSSIGVINACLYASGGLEKMEEFWGAFKAQSLLGNVSLNENVFVGNSILSMKRAFRSIEKFFDFQMIIDSPIEIALSLTNLSKGTAEMRSNRTDPSVDDFRTITRIGYTVPGLFPLIKFQGDYWCDGGFVWSIPFEHALEMGATRIVMLLCIGRQLPEEHRFGNIYQVLSRFYDVMWVHTASAGILHRDFGDATANGVEVHIVEPSTYLGGFGMVNMMKFNPSKAKKYIRQGYSDAREQLGTMK